LGLGRAWDRLGLGSGRARVGLGSGLGQAWVGLGLGSGRARALSGLGASLIKSFVKKFQKVWHASQAMSHLGLGFWFIQ
jgi:hypothetical protein